ncbi:sterol-4-alpha-carboxylate 3-dehydrogenase, decarboxylating [Aspergillus udagawae]|nr:sterol-4-alpha-carboxylate 3-dehydrogenase, decarboxylating [Aspergillus udagawae]
MSSIVLAACIVALVALYLYHVNRAMTQVPEEARLLSPRRWTVEEIKEAYRKAIESPIDVGKSLPPKQHRRYIVVGGSGLVGNWIVTHLLARGEDPTAVRILDLQSPRQQILDQGVAFVKIDITDAKAVQAVFAQPWPQQVASLPLTVFHNAAVIRPGERHKAFLQYCTRVNVDGTRNILTAAKQYGASCFVSTSSGSVLLRRPSFWIAPWTKWPKGVVQIISDAAETPKEHEQFFGNYAVSKAEAERIVRAADSLESNFRTGCIRPANGIYGVGDTTITGMYLLKGGAPSWTYPVIQSFVNAENVSIAHLLYEQRLLEHTASPAQFPNIGGQAFTVTDPNPAIAFSDIYLLMTTLAKTPIRFPRVPPVPFLLLSYLLEWYALLQHIYLPRLLPKITGDLAPLQPALFAISDVHTFADDSRARMAPADGGLGYVAPITTLEGMCKQVLEWNRSAGAETVAAVGRKRVVSVSEEGVDVNLVVPLKKL